MKDTTSDRSPEKQARRRISYYGVNRRVAKALGVSDSLVSDVLSGRIRDVRGIKRLVKKERRQMRAAASQGITPDSDFGDSGVSPSEENDA